MSASLSSFTSPRLRGEVGTPKRSAGVPGEGDSPRTELTESPPHPARTFGPRHPLPASGAREEWATA
jgi:DNA helicase II / ATP-dependent DNA helicase PcrA